MSHDRHFLDEVTTDSLHISGRKATHVAQDGDSGAKKRREQQIALGRRVEQRAEKIAALQAFANHGFKYGGSSSAIGAMKKREKEAQKLELEAETEADLMADLEEDAELALNLKPAVSCVKISCVSMPSRSSTRSGGRERLVLGR